MLKRILLASILLGMVWAQKAKVEDVPPIPAGYVLRVDGGSTASPFDIQKGNSDVFAMNVDAGSVEMTEKSPGDIALLSIDSRALPLLKVGVYDTLNVQISNAGSVAEDSVIFIVSSENGLVPTETVVVYITLNPGDTSVVQVPYQIGGSLGIDTLSLMLGDDDDNTNNGPISHYIEIWDDSTVAATSFSESPFPLGWTSEILIGSYSWERTTSGTNPTVSPLDLPAMAVYRSYSASNGSQARLISPKITILSAPRKVILRFHMVHDNGYSASYDSVYVEYSVDGVNFSTIQGFQRYDGSVTEPTWLLHEVEIGDFPVGTELYVALRAKSGYGNNMFIDSLWVYATEPTAPDTDAQFLSISIPKPVIQNDSNFVTISFKNSGLEPITTIDLFYTLGGADTVWETWTGNLIAGATQEYTFTTPLILPDTGEITVYAGVRLTGDTVRNDTASVTVHVWPYAQDLPYAENFDEDWSNSTNPPYGGWKIIDGGDEAPPTVNNNDWHRYVSSSRTVASVHYSPTENHDDWLISPRLRIMGYGTYTLNFWHYYNDYSTSRQDSGQVLISFDDGVTWTEITRYSNADNSGNVSLDITSYIVSQVGTSEYFRIAFHYGAYDEYYWNIDDFSVTYEPDTTPPMVEMIRGTEDTYDTTSDTVIFVVSDISPFYVHAYAVINDSVVAEYESDFEPGTDTITVVIPGAPQGTVYDGYIYVEDANGNSWMTQGAWWKLYAFTPGTPTLTPISEPQKGVRLSWASPRQSLVYDGGPTYYFSGIAAGDIMSVRFTPQYTPARIDSVVALFFQTSADMHLRIYDDNNGIPGNVLFDTLITVPVYPTYLVLNLADKNIIVNGEYHVGFEWTVNDQPYPLCDAGSNTNRSLYYEAASGNWYWVGYDWIVSSAVTYLPQSKAYAGSFVRTKLSKESNLKRIELPQIVLKEERSVDVKYIQNYTVLRSTTSGGPYDSIGISTGNTYDDFDLVTDNTYYYILRMDYVSPDTMTYGGEASITTDFVGPEFSAFDYDSGGVGDIWLSVDIMDPSGIYADTLYYSINGGEFVATVNDSISGSTYYYTIPGLNVGDNVDLYFVALDNSPWYNATRYPETGYISFLVTSVTDQKPTMYAFNIKGSNIGSRAIEFAYALPERTDIEISVYSVAGQKVATLVKGRKDAGYYTVRWNGTDGRGSKVGSGVYIVKMETPKKSFSARVILTK
ncbi:MAG: FlgD immunoglobulin-like domain containing protein [bacterium]|nr:FlgD immunoglobulin-like domain containing protein [bacterium]